MTTAKTTAPLKATGTDRKIEQKWGTALTTTGWTAIPNVIVQRQKALGLTPLDINIILQLLAYWWEPAGLPHPSKAKIAASIGVLPRTVQKRIAAMEAAGFIKRHERRTTRNGSSTNLYDFSGLIKAAQPFAREEQAEIAKRKLDKAAKLLRKRPVLAVVKS
jgi:DNA-binding transcriptional regulator YhcF (GntR family)